MTSTAESRLRLGDGSWLELGATLARAGEGTIYEVAGRPDRVFKVFHPTLSELDAKLDKVIAMVADTPRGAVQSDGFAVLAWPRQVVFDAGRPVGYLMARVDTATAVEIHTLSNPSNRANPLPGAPQWTADATWAHLVNAAANLCLAVQVVHRVDAVIGDFQERNILVSDSTRVTLVDCDSMQFTDGAGRSFLCGVARPEFTAPELAAVNLRTQPRERPSDLFALAVHIHLLLMGGNHPFMRGVWTGEGEQPGALTLAKSGDWAGGPLSRLKTHRLAPPPTFLPVEVQALFSRAFGDGATDPTQRPGPEQWRRALLDIGFTTCAGQSAHQIPVGCSSCPWCVIDDERRKRKQDTQDIPDQVILRTRKKTATAAKPAKSAPNPAKTVAGATKKATANVAPKKQSTGPVPAKRLATASSGPSMRPTAPSNLSPPPRQWIRASRWRSSRDVFIVAAVMLAVVVIAIAMSQAVSKHPAKSADRSEPPATALGDPSGVAVDSRGTVYVADRGNGLVLTLARGSTGQSVLRFEGLTWPTGVAVDEGGTVYVADEWTDRALAMAAGANGQSALGFAGLKDPSGVAVDSRRTVYVADSLNSRVLALAAGSAEQTVLPFAGLKDPSGVAVDGGGTVYVADSLNNRVLALAAGSAEQTVLPFAGLKDPSGVAVDGGGTVYVADSLNNRVLALAAGATEQRVLGFDGLQSPTGVAIDDHGTVYVADKGNDRVVALAAGATTQTVLPFSLT